MSAVSPASAQHTKSDIDGTVSVSPTAVMESARKRRKRKRVLLACTTCRARKQRCDGMQPKCSHCTQQKVACSYESASQKADVSQLYVHNLLQRIDQLEGELSHRRENSETSRPIPQTTRNDDEPRSLTGHATHTHPISIPGNYPRLAAVTDYLEEVHGEHGPLTPDTIDDPTQGYLGAPSTLTFIRTVIEDGCQQDHNQQEASISKRSRMTTGGQETCPHHLHVGLSNAIDSWPQRHLGDHLVDCYMELCYPQYPFLHGPMFRKRYESIWTARKPQGNLWAATVNIVFALGCQFSPTMSPDLGNEFFMKAKSLISLDILIGSATLEKLQTIVLMSLYLQSSANLNDSWNAIGLAVRVAQSLGLHLRKNYASTWTVLARETRKRAWWACYVLDSASSIMLGRPQVIPDDSFASVDLPACANDEVISDSSTAGSCSATPQDPADSRTGFFDNNKMSQMTFFVATIYLCQFMREVTKAYEDPLDHPRILDIDDRLCRWYARLPSYLQYDSNCEMETQFSRQNEVLASRFLNLRILLHRPCVSQAAPLEELKCFRSLRKRVDAQLLSLRAQICIEAAGKQIQHISDAYVQGPHSAWWYDLNYIVSAIAVLLAKIQHSGNSSAYTRLIKLGLSAIQRMHDTGKRLAGEYLPMLELLYRQIVEKNSAGTKPTAASPIATNQSCPSRLGTHLNSAWSPDSLGSQGLETLGPLMQHDSRFPMISSEAHTSPIDVYSLLEPLSFPWNMYSDIMPPDDYSYSFLDPLYCPPEACNKI